MNIKIFQQLHNIEDARGVAVIIDVFRAFSVEPYLINGGINKLFATRDIDDAFAYKKDNPSCILIGERGGKIIEGFDFGNSPADISLTNVKDKVAIHTTSAGTLGIASAKCASEILVASLLNAKATAEYIIKSKANVVSLICMGLEAKTETEEDTLCARYIKSILDKTLGNDYEVIDWSKEIEILKHTSGAKFFDPSLQEIFKEEDFNKCIEVDKFDFALKATKVDEKFFQIEKLI